VSDIIGYLRKVVAANGSQKETARVLCISPQYLCDILAGRREVSAEVAELLGFERVVSYVERRSERTLEPPRTADAVTGSGESVRSSTRDTVSSCSSCTSLRAAVETLVQEWRSDAQRNFKDGHSQLTQGYRELADESNVTGIVLNLCADQLHALLSCGEGAQTNGPF
jgi:DNA-binding transcriptional regulator YdaS (Cro superfamily)